MIRHDGIKGLIAQLDRIERGLAVGNGGNLEAPCIQIARHRHAEELFIFHKKDTEGFPVGAGWGIFTGGFGTLPTHDTRHPDVELRADTFFTFDGDFTAVLVHEILDRV